MGDFYCFGSFVLIILGIVVAICSSSGKDKRLANAKAAYTRSLRNLESDPADVAKRTAVVAAGRRYAEVAREVVGSKGRTIFDELALSNDLAARTGRSVEAAPRSSEHQADPLLDDVLEQIPAALSGPGRYRIFGVDRDSEMDTEIVVEAQTEANAKAKAELRGICVTDIKRL
jgi:hypothetical protein